MKIDELRELIRMMKDNQIAEIDLESSGEKVRIVAEAAPPPPPALIHYPQVAPQFPHIGPWPTPAAGPAGASAEGAGAAVSGNPAATATGSTPAPAADAGMVITSPIVGVFYGSPSPDQPAFVQVGDEIDESTVLCIIEAMKVMNEIKAETRGTLREILVTTGQSVEYGQPMFVIDPA